MTKVNVILGSTRKISIGKRLFKYLENSIAPLIAEREEIEFKFIQLTDYQFMKMFRQLIMHTAH